MKSAREIFAENLHNLLDSRGVDGGSLLIRKYVCLLLNKYA